jgi:hypothetical protein
LIEMRSREYESASWSWTKCAKTCDTSCSTISAANEADKGQFRHHWARRVPQPSPNFVESSRDKVRVTRLASGACYWLSAEW